MESAELVAGETTLAVGAELGDYTIEQVIGSGTEGTVYRARDMVLGRHVALKAFRLGTPAQTRCVEEARLLARLEHPNVLRVHHVRRHSRTWYVALEYAPHGNLYSRVRESGPLPVSEVMLVAMQITEALSYIHASGLIHRDVKPQNILQMDSTRVTLCDFGLATTLRATFSKSQGEVGTPAFLAPECWGEAGSSVASDVYALGASLYFIATGQLPFPAVDIVALRKEHEAAAPESPTSLPRGVRELILAMLAKCPEARPNLDRAFLSELNRLARAPESALQKPCVQRRASDTIEAGPELRDPLTLIMSLQVTELATRSDVTGLTSSEVPALTQAFDPYCSTYLHAVRKQVPCVVVGEHMPEVELLTELCLPRLRYYNAIRVTAAKDAGAAELLREIERRAGGPLGESVSATLERIQQYAGARHPGCVLSIRCEALLSPAQYREIGEIISAAPRSGISVVLLARRSSVVLSQFAAAQVVSLPGRGEALKGLVEAWVSDATGGRCKITSDAARLLVDVSVTQSICWVNLIRSSVIAARATGQYIVPSWAVLRAGAFPKLSDVKDVPAEYRTRPRSWPPHDIAERLSQLRTRFNTRGVDNAAADALSCRGAKEAAAAHLG